MMRSVLTISLLILSYFVTAQTEECTIGVASGRATADGRPLLWKTRDMSSAPNNKIQYITHLGHKFLAVTSDGNNTTPWMGLNEHGFAIINSSSPDLPGGSNSGATNGSMMQYALSQCKTVDDFQAVLDLTNKIGRTTDANFAVIDTTGAAAIFETGHYVYWKFDAEDTPNGYVLRTNFSINGGGTGGIERYKRTQKLIADFHSGDSLNYKSILRYQMRDFSDAHSNQLPIPYLDSWEGKPEGYIYNNLSICRNSSVSATVIHGTLPAEPAKLSTFWTLLGQPATSIFTPYWVIANPPAKATSPTTAPLCNISLQIRANLYDLWRESNYINTKKLRNESGEGLWTKTFPFEDRVMVTTDSLMAIWRTQNTIPVDAMVHFQDSIATTTYNHLLYCYEYLNKGMTAPVAINPEGDGSLINASLYPNPFNREIKINFTLREPSHIAIELYTLAGVKMGQTYMEQFLPGHHQLSIGEDFANLAPGLFIVKLQINGESRIFKAIKK